MSLLRNTDATTFLTDRSFKSSDVPSHVVIKDVPREFVEITFGAAADYAFRCHQLHPSPPEPLVVEAAIVKAWKTLMEDKEYDPLEWKLLFPSDRILTFFEELPPALQSVFGEDTSVERVVNHASIRMELLREELPPPPPGHPGQITPLFVGEDLDLATMALAEEGLRASEWQCYLHNVAWEHLRGIYGTVMSSVKEYTDAERDGQNLLWGQEDPFNYSEKDDWQINCDTHWAQDMSIWDRIGKVQEDIWNFARGRALRSRDVLIGDPEGRGHKGNGPDPPKNLRDGNNDWER